MWSTDAVATPGPEEGQPIRTTLFVDGSFAAWSRVIGWGVVIVGERGVVAVAGHEGRARGDGSIDAEAWSLIRGMELVRARMPEIREITCVTDCTTLVDHLSAVPSHLRERILALRARFDRVDVSWVRAHSGRRTPWTAGNHLADRLARRGRNLVGVGRIEVDSGYFPNPAQSLRLKR